VARNSTFPFLPAFDDEKFDRRPSLRRLLDRRLEGHPGLRHAVDADPDTARMDPFFDESTLILTCDVIEPSDGKGYDRDPRSIAKRAEAYLKSTGIGDTAYFGPEPEFFIFDSVTWHDDMSGCGVKINSEEAAWSSAEKFEGGNIGHRPGSRAATSRFPRSTACRTSVPPWCWRWRNGRSGGSASTTKSPPPASARSAPCSRR
jgi:hypothetical protein